MSLSKDVTALTDQQKEIIREEFKAFSGKVDLLKITRKVGNDDTIDGRHNLGKLVKQFIANELNGEVKTTKYEKVNFELSEEDKSYIRNNYKNYDGKNAAWYIAKHIFSGSILNPFGREVIAIQNFLKEIAPEMVDPSGEYATAEYRPPTSFERVIPRLKTFVPEYTTGKYKIPKIDDLTDVERKQMTSLIGYLNTHRFKTQINSYDKKSDRELFESTFIRYTHDKTDLMQEEVDQYIVICDETVSQGKIQRLLEALDRQIDGLLEEEDGFKKIPGNLVELMNTNREKLNASRTRVEKMTKELTGSRSKRMETKIQENASILNLVNAWMSEKQRLRLIEMAEKQKEAERKEVDNLADMEGVIALIAGFSKEQAKH